MDAFIGELLALAVCGAAIKRRKCCVKHLDFPRGRLLQEKVRYSGKIVTDATTVGLATDELTAFLHFGINTFTGQMGDGTGRSGPVQSD